MIDESAGATPFGIFTLADSYLTAAKLCEGASQLCMAGPLRLMSYHAIELYLKTHLRSHGWMVADLRLLKHDILKMAMTCQDLGMKFDRATIRLLLRIKETNDYVRVRYAVVDKDGSVRPAEALQLAKNIREAIRQSLNFDEFGNPQTHLWASDAPPADYVIQAIKTA